MTFVPPKHLVVVTGLAGSGKTLALHALEDIGYTCIDNLPSALIGSFIDSMKSHQIAGRYIALALDSRDPHLSSGLKRLTAELVAPFCETNILFLDSIDEVLLMRFRETRRPHPLSRESHGSHRELSKGLVAAIAADRALLEPFKDMASSVIDTSSTTSQYLRNLIKNRYRPQGLLDSLDLQLVSFGFKHGVPTGLDTMFDVRCFANPHYIDELRPLTGLDNRVRDFVFEDKGVDTFLTKSCDLIRFLYPLYVEEGKSYFCVGIGCTGGKHRSVAIVEDMAKRLQKEIPTVRVEHRHFNKE